MNLITADLWDCQGILCITTNGFVKNNGEGVMGAGVAKQATERIPGIAASLGRGIRDHGNVVLRIAGPDVIRCEFDRNVLAFPVKHNWRYKADLELIERSAKQLARFYEMGFISPYDDEVFLPKPGCGNGGLTWPEVEATLEPHLGTLPHIYIVDR